MCYKVTNKFSMKVRNSFGFTLIELLVVISIISLISSVALASMNTARDKARSAKAITEMRQIADAIIVAQGETGTTTKAFVYESGLNPTPYCTDCACRNTYRVLVDFSLAPISTLKNITSTDLCYSLWEHAINRINTANGGVIDISNFKRDPWGSPYLLDENEGELPLNHPDCGSDSIRSAGPDGQIRDTNGSPLLDDDDLWIEIPYLGRSCLP